MEDMPLYINASSPVPIFALIESVGTTANSFAHTILCTQVEKRVTLFADLFN